MLITNVLSQSFSKATGIRHTKTMVLTAFILAGLTVACATTKQPISNDPVASKPVAQASNKLPLQEQTAISPQTHLPGHDFGDIYGAIDPGLSQRADPPSFIYWVNGQMVVRRSELGPLTEPADNFFPTIAARGPGHDFGAIYGDVDPDANQSADPVSVSVAALEPGHDFGAIYGAFDPGKSLCIPQPKLTYTFNGITIIRRSELGPLTETVDNCLQTVVP
jgi:hypothetical protein